MIKTEKSFVAKISIIMATRMLGLFMILPVFAILASDYQNSNALLIGLAIGIYGLTQAIFQIPFGYLSDKFGRKPLLIIGLIILAQETKFGIRLKDEYPQNNSSPPTPDILTL